jgi:hypothetical protein
MEYHRTKDILPVIRLVGHKSIANTLIYTRLAEFEDDDKYCTATADNVEEARKLLEAGFEFVCGHSGITIVRKKKWSASKGY